MEKQSDGGHLLECLESSGTKIMTRGPIDCQLCMGRYRETNDDLDDEFQGYVPTLLVYYLIKVFRQTWSLLEPISAEATI